MNARLLLVSLTIASFSVACRSPEDSESEMSEGEPLAQNHEPNRFDPDTGMETDTESLGTQIVINEFMPSNATIVQDEAGGSGDWIELYNLTDAAIDLSGYFISDNADNPTKAELGAGLTIEAGGTLLLWADSDIEQGATHLPFNLSKDGEVILITSPLGEVLDSIDYENATTDSSFARVPDGVGEFAFCNSPTPDAPNDPACGL